jgi:molybdate transport system substrate-binding protein
MQTATALDTRPPGTPTIRGISSMATRQVLADLTAAYECSAGLAPGAIAIESVGGVDAARRVAAGEAFDLVILAADAIDKLVAGAHLAPGSRVDLVRSGVAVAVQAGATRPDIGSEAAVRRAVLGARSLSYSTGPSGVALVKLFERWGIADEVRPRIVQAPPGVPVGSLVASGQVELGFQQLSELINLPGIDVIGTLPPEIQIITTFSAGVGSGLAGDRAEAVRSYLAFLTSAEAAGTIRRQGMEPA